MDEQLEKAKRRQFVWGALLAWSPFVAVAIAIFNVFRELSATKATGMGAVAGGVSEFLVTYGLAAAFGVEVAAIILLIKAGTKGHPARTVFSSISICFSALIIILLGLFFWQTFARAH